MVSKWNAVRAEVLLEEEIEAAAHAPESIEELARRAKTRRPGAGAGRRSVQTMGSKSESTCPSEPALRVLVVA